MTRDFLLGFVIPLSALAGIADWGCHRASDIEHTAGTKEAVMHLLMMAEVGMPLFATLFLDITTPVLAMLLASFLLHEATALLDVTYAVAEREVTPAEQMIHSFMEMAPMLALSFLAATRWTQFLALFGLGDEAPDMAIRLRRNPPKMSGRAAAASALALSEGLLYLEEFWRTYREKRGRSWQSK